MKRIDTLRRLGGSLLLASVLLVAATSAAAAAPALRVTSFVPDTVTAGKGVALFVSVQNVGPDPLDGNLTVRYTFPAGVAPVDPEPFFGTTPPVTCQTAGQVDECVADVTGIASGSQVRYKTSALVDLSATGTITGQIEVSGGGTGDDVVVPVSLVVGPADPFAIKSFGLTLSDAPAGPGNRAGTDPSQLDTNVSFPSSAQTNLDFFPQGLITSPPESFKDVVAHVPPGFVGNPTATPLRCTATQLVEPIKDTSIPTCPPESQIGLVQLNGGDIVPLYNMVPARGTPAQFGFYYLTLPVTLTARLRPSDNGIDIIAKDTSSSAPIPKFTVTMWGVPGDPSHDQLRAVCLDVGAGYNPAHGDCSLQTQRVPFLRTPTSCPRSPLVWGIEVNTYQHPDVFHTASTTTPAIEGCQDSDLSFDPSLSITPSTRAPHAPTGVDATLTMPQDYGPDGIAPADLKSASVTLPKGLTINPSSADGLAACTDAQLGLNQDGAAGCPDASKLGTVTLRSPLLDHQVGGSIFLRNQNSDDPKSGELFRLAVEIRSDEDGIDIKLPGAVKAGDDGQLTTVFDGLPQLPFSSMTLHFKTGQRAPLASPPSCGTHTTDVQLVSHGGAMRNRDSSFTLDERCGVRGFAPALRAGVGDPTAAKSGATFSLQVTRSDDDQEISSITTTMPKGLLAHIGDVPLGAQIGTVTVGAGVGANPLYLNSGKVLLTGPYKGAPYGLDIQVPAVAGPFNLGVVDVKARLDVDPVTAQAVVTSDPMPRFVKGVPVLARDIRVTIDRPGFMVNPTNCTQQQLTTTIGSFDGATAAPSQRFQTIGCNDLALAPKLAIALTGKGQTTDDKHPGVHATLTQAPGQSNLKKVAVSLPLSLALDTDNANGLCEFTDGSKIDPTCPKSSIVGRAVARTPILDQPLTGPVYFVKNVRKDPKSGRAIRTLPKLVIPLTGENGLRINLVGTSSVVDNRLVTTFDNIPDAPVSDFTLDINGGKGGILAVSGTDICKATQVAEQQVGGQNGKNADADVYLQTPACALKILTKKVGKTSVAVKVGGLGAGKVTVSGKGIKKTRKTIAKSTVATITAKRTKGKPGKVTVSFDPTGPAKARKTSK